MLARWIVGWIVGALVGSAHALTGGSIPAVDSDWEQLISYRPPLAIQTELAARSVSGWAWRPLRIENGLGVVNLDFYAIEIKKMPVASGAPLNQKQLLKLVREKFSTLIDPRQSDFLANSVQDAAKWQSSDPAGAVMRFKLKFNNINIEGGTVVAGEVTPLMWRFSTIYSQKDWKHPVSGSREFGVATLTDGRVIVYTMAADRPTNYWDSYVTESLASGVKSILKQLGFETLEAFLPSLLQSGEKIWEEYQRRVVSLIKENGGEAVAMAPIVRRPAWPSIGAYFHPSVPWLGDYVAVNWDGPNGEMVRPISTSFGRAIGQVNSNSDHPRGVLWVDSNSNGFPDPGETSYLPDEGKPSEVTGLGRDGVAIGMLGRRFVSPRAAIWLMGSTLRRVAVPNTLSSQFDGWISSNEFAGTAKVPTIGSSEFTQITKAFVWKDDNLNFVIEPDELEFLPNLVSGLPAEVTAVAENGLVVGTSLDQNKVVQAVLWRRDGTVVSLGSFISGNSVPTAVNSNSVVVGYADVSEGVHAFLWRSGVLIDLGTLGGKNSYANSINMEGTAVGSAEDSSGERRGVLWKTTQPEDLSKLVFGVSNLVVTDARFIDNNGLILVSGTENGVPRAAFLVPLH